MRTSFLIAMLLLLSVPAISEAKVRHQAPAPQESCFLLGCLVKKTQAVDPGPKPSAWCGWWMQIRTGLTSAMAGINLNVARNWARVGKPAEPGPGVIVVRPHHVEQITGPGSRPGQWKMISGNSGKKPRRVREYERTVAGAIALRKL